ncbi:hypothetical protein HGRIS_007523 [Hohenbuehelia grisea]|uniref:Methyltransferase small domain-containing protein n=1 Tax=Hohenbuehelia grisea TaxID=104357 RepID=A0ABR3J6I8_9AGAR
MASIFEPSLPTPDLSHLTRADYEHVYEPAEDTFLLLDALEKDAQELRQLKPQVCLEIGSGSGCVSSFLGALLPSSSALYLCTDINQHACRCTKATGSQNKVTLEPIIASLASPLQHRLANQIDILVFNPPYVPTTSDEADAAQVTSGISGAWAGGKSGMELTNILLSSVPKLLSPGGRFYLVGVVQNGVEEIRQRMRQAHGLDSEIVLERRAGRERLWVVKFFKAAAPS